MVSRVGYQLETLDSDLEISGDNVYEIIDGYTDDTDILYGYIDDTDIIYDYPDVMPAGGNG